MSIWTHVNISIRLDDLRILSTENGKEFIEIFLENNVPSGSEEALKFKIWENPALNSIFSYQISIFGDLRDFHYDDKKEILDFLEKFEKEMKSNNKTIRDAVCRIYCEENSEAEIYSYHYEEGFLRYKLTEEG